MEVKLDGSEKMAVRFHACSAACAACSAGLVGGCAAAGRVRVSVRRRRRRRLRHPLVMLPPALEAGGAGIMAGSRGGVPVAARWFWWGRERGEWTVE